MKITFIGAAHEVTGSSTLLELNGKYYMVDHGMKQGMDTFETAPLPVSPKEIEAVFLTHAHIDHSGMLPKLYKDGFRGGIYATEATCNLCNIMLKDSAHIQMSEAEWKNRKAERAGEGPYEPIYDLDDAIGAISLFHSCAYDKQYQIAEGVIIRFTDVGHLLGSACIEIWMVEDGISKKIVFSGDVGNTNQPIIKDPQTPEETDYLVVESTYGNRLHEKPKDTIEELSEYLQRAFDRGGSVIIPAFAVGRTQELLYALREIKQKGLISGHDGFPVYVDSPLAEEATAVFMQCDTSCFDDETRSLIAQGINPIWFDDIRLSVTADDSKRINLDTRNKVILSASGMCEAGRIRHHLKHNLWKKENIILFAGYQAVGSLGRIILDGVDNVRLFGENIAVKAEICSLHGISGHADRQGLINWISAFRKKPDFIFVNHGDEQSSEDFKNLLVSDYRYNATSPFSGTEFDLKTGKATVLTEGIKIDRNQAAKGRSRAQEIYATLVDTANELLRIVKGSKGMSNKELAKFTDQIRGLIEKWK
ncbi:MAG: MBL fold metallo-hydrolase [Clostridiaceae bacterium]|nr:MBL fold metallo-hydrolase [Clostridiaceae bacterium]